MGIPLNEESGGREKDYLKKWEGTLSPLVVYGVLNTDTTILYIYLHKKQPDQQKQRRQSKRRTAKKELKQSTSSYKIYGGVKEK